MNTHKYNDGRAMTATSMPDDTSYMTIDSAAGRAVLRKDGSYAEFLSGAEADKACADLEHGRVSESDFEWVIPDA